MRYGLIIILILLSGLFPAQAQVLSYEEVLENIPGIWAVPFAEEDGDDPEKTITDCAQSHIRIQITDRNGTLHYIAQHSGRDGVGFPPHEQVVEQAIHTDGRVLPALHIKCENEERLDEDGNSVSWYLFMITRDEFIWSAAHWDLKGFAPIRTRCEVIEDVS